MWNRFIIIIWIVWMMLIFELPFNAETKVTFLSVGQGDCSLLQTKTGETYLIDCGSSNRGKVGEYVLLPYLKYSGIQTIDGVLVSHADEDHVSGIQELLLLAEENGITVKQLIVPDIEEKLRQREFGPLLDAAAVAYGGKGIPVRCLAAGEGWHLEGADFLCLHPQTEFTAEESNEYSMCIYADLKEASVLFTGDVEGTGEAMLLETIREYGISDVTVLKVSHHGSRYATGEAFLKQIRPQAAVISCGENNWYGHPHQETLQRLESAGCKIFTTPQYGAITVEVDKEAVKVFGFAR